MTPTSAPARSVVQHYRADLPPVPAFVLGLPETPGVLARPRHHAHLRLNDLHPHRAALHRQRRLPGREWDSLTVTELQAFLSDYCERPTELLAVWESPDQHGESHWDVYFDWAGPPRVSVTPLHARHPELRPIDWALHLDLDTGTRARASAWTEVDHQWVRTQLGHRSTDARLWLARVTTFLPAVRISSQDTPEQEAASWLTGPEHPGTQEGLALARAWCDARLAELGADLG